jgi:effector-binding domain-containing protein
MASEYTVETIAPARLVAVTATLQPDELGDHIGPMFDRVADALGRAPGSLDTPIATYSQTESGTDVVVGYVSDAAAPAGTQLVELPEATAVCGVHLGPMADIQDSWQQLHTWIADNGYAWAGPCREVYVRAVSDDQSDWVTELQQPVTSPGS